MELYMRFISSLAFGLIGVGLVLRVLLDGLFNEWDAFHEIAEQASAVFSGRAPAVDHIRAEDILLEAEKQNTYSLVSSGSRLADQKRQQIQELDEIETRLSQVQGLGALSEPAILPS